MGQEESRGQPTAPAIAVAAGAALVLFALALGCYQANIFDLPWHLRTGEWIVDHRAVPAVDFYSFTRAGMEWIDAQWLFQLIIFGFVSALGPSGVTVFVMLGASALVGLVCFSAPEARAGSRAVAGLLYLLAANLRLLPRPEMISLIGVAGLVFIFERARQGRTRALLLTFPVALVWSNSEGLWPIAAFVAGAYAVEAWWERRRGPAPSGPLWPWFLATAGAVVAGLVQPYGLRGFLFPLTLLREVTHPASAHKQLIAEFQPIIAPFMPGESGPLLLLAALTAAAIIAAGKRLRPAPVILAAVFFGLALSARRNIGLAAVAMAPALLIHLEIAARQRPWLGGRAAQTAAAVAATAGAVIMIAVCLIWPTRTWDHSFRDLGFGMSPRFYPLAATRLLEQTGYRGRVITDIGIGGYFIYRGWPNWQVSGDSRLEIGGEEWLEGAIGVFLEMEKFQQLARESGAGAVAVYHFVPYLRAFAVELSRDPEWALVFVDPKCAVFLRRNEQNRAAIAAHEVDLQQLLRKAQSKK